MIVRLALASTLFAFLPLIALAQTIIVQEQDPSSVSYQLQQLLKNQGLTTPSFNPWENLVPPSYDNAVGTLEASLIDPRFVPQQIVFTPLASTSPEVQALFDQVAALQVQIAAIVAAQATSTPTSIPQSGTSTSSGAIACPSITRTLLFGSEGTDVVNLQIFLIDAGHLAAGNATGFFGVLTQAAVQAWQAAKAIVSSGTPEETGYGVVGPQTRAALQACS